MPFVNIPVKTREALRKLANEVRSAKNERMRDFYERRADGFFIGIRTLLPSEVVGMLVMDYDLFLKGEAGHTEQLPRLVLTG